MERAGIEVVATLTRGEDVADRVEALRPDVVVMDVRLAGRMDGVEAALIVRRRWHGPILFHSANDDAASRRAMSAIGDTALVPKPASPDTVAAVAGDLAAGRTPPPRLAPAAARRSRPRH